MTSLGDKIMQHMMGAFTFDLGRYLIAAGVVSLILITFKTWAEARRIQTRKASIADYKREFFSSLRTVLVFGVTTISTVLFIEFGWVKIIEGPVNWPLFALQLGIMIVAHDAYFYWMHRALHLKPLFRVTHLHHHKSRTPTPWAAYSFTTFEAAAEAAFVPLFLLLMQTHGLAVFIFLAHMILRNVIGHSGVEFFPSGWTHNKFLGWITTTTHHDLHHSEGNSNFGLYFTWWDRFMGTEHPDYHARFERAAKPAQMNVQTAAHISVAAMATTAVAATMGAL